MNKTIQLEDIRLVRKVGNYDNEYHPKLEIEEFYMTPCSTVGYPTKYWTPEKLLEEHQKCETCNFIYTNRSKGLTDHLLIELFGNNINVGRKLTSRNFTIQYLDDGSQLMEHNGRFEMLRREDGLVIHNSEHIETTRSMMGAHVSCPRYWNLNNALVQIPLATIAREYYKSNGWDEEIFLEICDNIHILDNANMEYAYNPKILFKLKSHRLGKEIYFMHLRDEQHNYLIELPKPVYSVESAEHDLMPTLALKSGEYVRQGDLFFIPLEDIPKDSKIEKQHFEKSFMHLIDNDIARDEIAEAYKKVWYPKNQDVDKWNITRMFLKEMFDDRQKNLETNPKLKPIYDVADKYLKDIKGELTKIQVLDTNHNCQMSTHIGNTQIVKGWIMHENKDHHRIKLDNWCLVFKNEQRNSFMVDVNRGGVD